MSEGSPVSPHGTAMYGTEHDYTPDPTKIARRSISIFSRRGSESLEPRPSSLMLQSAMARTPSKLLNDRQRGWLRRRSLDFGKTGESPKKTKGTILKAVPAAETIRMTSLEEEMSTSPNEEIVSAISERNLENLDACTSSREASPTQRTFAMASPVRGGWAQQAQSPRRRTGSGKRQATKERIGVWVDGVVHWESKSDIQHMVADHKHDVLEDDVRSPTVEPAALRIRHNWRPSLTVTIPPSQPLISDLAFETIVQAHEPKPTVSVAPAETATKFVAAPLDDIVDQFPVRYVSPLETETQRHASPIISLTEQTAREDTFDDAPEEAPGKHHRTSSSTASSVSEHDDSSAYSKRSSATSLDASQVPDAKCLAPPGLPKDASDAFSIISPAEAGIFNDARSIMQPADVNKPLPRVPAPQAMRSAPGPPSASPKPTSIRPLRSIRSIPGTRKTGPVELRHMSAQAPVSYTHLTLPTKRIV